MRHCGNAVLWQCGLAATRYFIDREAVAARRALTLVRQWRQAMFSVAATYRIPAMAHCHVPHVPCETFKYTPSALLCCKDLEYK